MLAVQPRRSGRGLRRGFLAGIAHGVGRGGRGSLDAGAGKFGHLLGGLLLGALAAGSKDKDGGGSSPEARQAVDSCSSEAMNQASRYGVRARIDRITKTRRQGESHSVEGDVTVDVGPRSVTYSFDCDYDGRYARVELN